MRCGLSLPPPLYNCIIYVTQHCRPQDRRQLPSPGNVKTTRGRLAPGRGPSFAHPGVRRFFRYCSNNAHVFLHIAYFPKTTVDTLIEYYIFLYNMILWDLCSNPSYPKCPSSLRGRRAQATLHVTSMDDVIKLHLSTRSLSLGTAFREWHYVVTNRRSSRCVCLQLSVCSH